MRAAKHLLRLAMVAAAIAGTLSGCGSTTVVGSGRTLRVGLTEYRVVPQNVRAEPGRLTIIVENNGRLTHNLAVSRNGTIVGQTAPLPPGALTDLSLTLPPGKYLMYSSMFSDQALGEYGTLTVGS